MNSEAFKHRQATRQLSRSALEAHQLARFNEMLTNILPTNTFYAHKLSGKPTQLESLSQLSELPFTTKDELLTGVSADDDHWLPANLTHPSEAYVRYHQTSGTSGRPMVVLDTAQDWAWWIEGWQHVLDSAGVTENDRAMLAFSFGPFIGFWTAHDAIITRGALAIPGGGMNTIARLELMRTAQATVLCCTPTYALHLAEVAAEKSFRLADLHLRSIIVAGEPGGSIPTVRARIENAFSATVIDHAGASEIGPWGFADSKRKGLHILESEFIAEFISVETGSPASSEELSHLVLTSLGRNGAPVIRYRTGDLVRPSWTAIDGCNFVHLDGGVLSRADDMMIIRGVNIFPRSVEQILHGFPEIAEYRMTAMKVGEMDSLSLEVEDRIEKPERISEELKIKLGLSVQVQCVPIGTLPRFEGKGRRFIDKR